MISFPVHWAGKLLVWWGPFSPHSLTGNGVCRYKGMWRQWSFPALGVVLRILRTTCLMFWFCTFRIYRIFTDDLKCDKNVKKFELISFLCNATVLLSFVGRVSALLGIWKPMELKCTAQRKAISYTATHVTMVSLYIQEMIWLLL